MDERSWLEEHAHELDPEEPISEKLKQRFFNGKWPVPTKLENLGVFENIVDDKSFNKIVGNPKNWKILLEDKNIFENWVFPKAVLLFGKTWYYRSLKQSISKAINISLQQEPATIAKIVEKTYNVLIIYLEGRWYNGKIKQPSGYIINSLKNQFVKEMATDLGFKYKIVFVCPSCLVDDPPRRVSLTEYKNRVYSCPRCSDICKSVSYEHNDNKRKIFSRFIGITCICPSDDCKGVFVPISCAEKIKKGALKNVYVNKNIKKFQYPPESILDFNLTCPHCGTKFTPRWAIKQKSGFNGKSGYLTGLPTTRIWVNKKEPYITKPNQTIDMSLYFDELISIDQRLNVILSELLIKISKIKVRNTNDLSTLYFFSAVVKWIYKNKYDANMFFFGKPKIKEHIYRAIFQEWIKLLEENINNFNKLDENIKSIKSFEWLARRPKFYGGPEVEFYSEVNNNYIIPNGLTIKQVGSNISVRLVKIISLHKDGIDYTNEIEELRWQSIKVSDKLKPKDKVLVKALIMSGHHSHSPIKRILRMKETLKEITNRILHEEETGEIDITYWDNWRNKVKDAKEKLWNKRMNGTMSQLWKTLEI